MNRYTYAHNDPVQYVDPSGHYCVSADGRYSHPGACSSPTSTYIPDEVYYNRNKSQDKVSNKSASSYSSGSNSSSGSGSTSTSGLSNPGNNKQQESGGSSSSIVDYMDDKGMDPSFENRKKIAEEIYGIDSYSGTAEQNMAILAKMRSNDPTPIVEVKTAVTVSAEHHKKVTPTSEVEMIYGMPKDEYDKMVPQAQEAVRNDYFGVNPVKGTPEKMYNTQCISADECGTKFGNQSTDDRSNKSVEEYKEEYLEVLRKDMEDKLRNEYKSPDDMVPDLARLLAAQQGIYQDPDPDSYYYAHARGIAYDAEAAAFEAGRADIAMLAAGGLGASRYLSKTKGIVFSKTSPNVGTQGKSVAGDNKAVNSSGAKDAGNSRPSWRQSEKDVEANNPTYDAQKSFKGGKEVPYGTSGSSRPDLYTTGNSIEVKNYKVTTSSGRNSLVNNVTNQVNKRLDDLPSGTKQTVIIDVRGQNVSNDVLRGIRDSITQKTNGNAQIQFMR